MITALLIEESRWERAARVAVKPIAWTLAVVSSIVAGACLVDVGNVFVYGLHSVLACVMLQVALRREPRMALPRRA